MKEIKIIEITKPTNIVYPLSRELFENTNIVYHGTSSSFAELIEKRGWEINKPVYDIGDIKFLCDIYDSILYANSPGYVVLRSFTLGVNDYYLDKKLPSFTQDYWIARNYAYNPGGETIRSLITAIDDYFTLINDINSLKVQKEKLQCKLDKINKQNSIYYKNLKIHGQENKEIENYLKTTIKNYTQAIEKIENKNYLNNSAKKFQEIKDKYKKFIENHIGIVYAVKVQPEWFKNWREAYFIQKKIGEISYRRSTPEVNLFAKGKIPQENIIAKIVFPNGIKPYRPDSFQPLPLPWTMDAFKKYISEQLCYGENEFLNKYK